ncbi:threonine/serine exporter family protein [Fusobacterium perfoetens]|uniref:threonine/serine exporter family protein n=1 Tax=Fusobacterium perfoetens TaxID=852 RepID=UPI0026F37963|nr:threonine/serine exporter family protein [Fusobacterium perfoetens]
MIGQFGYSALATYGFCLIFNVRGIIGFYASIVGGLGWLVYYIFNEMGYSLAISFFLAGATATLGSEIIARKLKTPVTSSLIPTFTPLVPGSGAYYTMLYLINGQYEKAMEKGAETFIISIAIIFGFLVVTDFFKLYTKYKRKREGKK